LDADYAASLANWKRNEIDVERAKLKQELADDLSRLGFAGWVGPNECATRGPAGPGLWHVVLRT